MALTEEVRAFIAQHMGEDKAKEIEAALPSAAAGLKAAGVDYKAVDTDQIVEAVKAAIDVKGLSDLIKGIDERTQAQAAAQEESVKGLKELLKRVEKLERSDDDKVAATLTAKSHGDPVWKGYRASQSPDTTIDQKEADVLGAPQENWLVGVLAETFHGIGVR